MRNHTARAKQTMRATTTWSRKQTVFEVLCEALDKAGIEYTVTSTPHTLNAIVGVVGLIGVWFTTHNPYAIAWAVFGMLHIEWKIRKNTRKESHGTR